MANPSKKRGTDYETRCVNYMCEMTGDDRIEGRALHGSKDMGDIYGIFAHGWEGIGECKAHKVVTPALVTEWREQTVAERENAGAGFGLLIVNVYRAPIWRSIVHVTLRDLARIALPVMVCDGWEARADDTWTCMTLFEACMHISGRFYDKDGGFHEQ